MFSRSAIAAAIVLVASSAYAFQEESAATSSPGKQPVQPGVTTTVPGVALQDDTATLQKSPEGTVVSIPGLGRLGIIPKLDFGLELLYGAAKQPTLEVPEKERTDDDDLRIRGSVKHRF